MDTLKYFNYLIAIIFAVCYSYQVLYIFVGIFFKPRTTNDMPARKYAVLVSARNEQAVIAQLISSIKSQKYPSELIDIFVVADNCTDNTAKIARDAGATVYERFNMRQVGKGYALEYLFELIRENHSDRGYQGYFVFDADNLLDENYVREMNKMLGGKYKVLTSYRNSKNYGSNWISAGYSLWFLREAKYLNNPRCILGTSCAISGTGFLLHKDIVEKNNGWKHFLLTEDIEFTASSIVDGDCIGYCHKAMLYDEQPVLFSQSWTQRMRWAKGYLQVFRKYGGRLGKNLILKGSFACYDMSMSIMPAIILTAIGMLVNLSGLYFGYFMRDIDIYPLILSILESLGNAYLVLYAIGLLTTISEWRNIRCKAWKKLLYTFSFPIFMFTYIPISFVALFKKVEWKPINHSITKTIEDIRTIK
jgi:cellulose synthase/poly-beta-1,6-N-acetylglucosamine synthase-like glycosyltransferase